MVEDLGGKSVVNHLRREQSDTAVVVFEIVPVKKALAKSARVCQRAEAVREVGSVLQRLERTLRKRIVVGDIGSAL